MAVRAWNFISSLAFRCRKDIKMLALALFLSSAAAMEIGLNMTGSGTAQSQLSTASSSAPETISEVIITLSEVSSSASPTSSSASPTITNGPIYTNFCNSYEGRNCARLPEMPVSVPFFTSAKLSAWRVRAEPRSPFLEIFCFHRYSPTTFLSIDQLLISLMIVLVRYLCGREPVRLYSNSTTKSVRGVLLLHPIWSADYSAGNSKHLLCGLVHQLHIMA